ncbi:copper resistance CopC/CopD family protein [Kribbella pratensis]|uniref:Copper transport protein n=1 Tax=Kribbella pratensis TaxID=2512112 RepID=A0A4R8CMD2_9ACTN|nr:copper resistance protein CopC [Kribbella pratensis]TDW77203.1 copper transport protein [Kribbella pratensis]
MRHRCVLLLVSVLLLCALPSVAFAHTELVRSDPADGAVLAESPGLARLWFSGDVDPTRSTARLVDERGTTMPGTQAVRDSGDRRALAVELPRLTDGSYGLLWEAVAARDGHTTSGTVTFSIGHSGALVTVASGGPGGLVQRWLWLLALAGVVGPLALVVFVLRAPSDPVSLAARQRLLVTSLASAVVALVIHHSGLQLITLAGLCALVVLVLAGRVASVAVLVPLGVLGWLEATSSHAAALPSGRSFALVAGAVHALAGLLWLGAVPALLVVFWRAPRAELARQLRGPFSVLAAGSVLLLVASGLYSAGREVATPRSLVTASYGRLLLAKTALLVGMGVLGLLNAWRLRRRSVPRRTIAAESTVGAVLLIAVAALIGQAPPSTVSSGSSGVEPEVTRSGFVSDLVVTVSATPNQPGVNWLTVLADSTRRPAPAPLDSVDLRIGGETVGLQHLTGTRYFATYQAGSAGAVRMVAVLHRGGQEYAVPIDWQVSSPAVRSAAGQRLAPYVDVAALLVLELGVVVCAWWLVRGHGGRR